MCRGRGVCSEPDLAGEHDAGLDWDDRAEGGTIDDWDDPYPSMSIAELNAEVRRPRLASPLPVAAYCAAPPPPPPKKKKNGFWWISIGFLWNPMGEGARAGARRTCTQLQGPQVLLAHRYSASDPGSSCPSRC